MKSSAEALFREIHVRMCTDIGTAGLSCSVSVTVGILAPVVLTLFGTTRGVAGNPALTVEGCWELGMDEPDDFQSPPPRPAAICGLDRAAVLMGRLAGGGGAPPAPPNYL
ncbi:unnamed protein product [Pleuronectes platessa]|uniref:Uncharacterized protein n=1 Tax=Pleuronectes platessa TaxID=8262 RepID=A0A9N7YS90_PLEPL|nr:unnamed protein product [Pleuronectes platessa]